MDPNASRPPQIPPQPALDPYQTPVGMGAPAGSDGQDMLPILQGAVFPLRLSFKFFTFAPTMKVTDAAGRQILYVRQKLFRLREQVEVFTDETRSQKVAHIAANKIIDWSARYTFTDAGGREIGSTGRRGMRSLWRACYDVFNPGDNVADFEIREENPMAKVLDGLVGNIPLVGLLTLYLFHPKYLATRQTGVGGPAMRVTKQPAFLEGRFSVDKLGPMTDRETLNLILSFLMLVLLERRRG